MKDESRVTSSSQEALMNTFKVQQLLDTLFQGLKVLITDMRLYTNSLIPLLHEEEANYSRIAFKVQ